MKKIISLSLVLILLLSAGHTVGAVENAPFSATVNALNLYAGSGIDNVWDEIAVQLALRVVTRNSGAVEAFSDRDAVRDIAVGSAMWYAAIDSNWSTLAVELIAARYLQAHDYAVAAMCAQKLASVQQLDGSWHMYGAPDLSSTIYAVAALDMLNMPFDAEAASEWFRSVQLADGGFTFWGDEGDVDATAMVLIALAHLPDTDSEIDAAVNFILQNMTENGGFVSPWSETGDENCNTAATVISGLIAVGYSERESESAILDMLTSNLLSFARTDGGFAYEASDEDSNAFATNQALIALCELQLGASYACEQEFDDRMDDSVLVSVIGEIGLMIGDEHGFRGNDGVTYAELATVLMRFSSLGSESYETYADLPRHEWYTPAMSFVRANGMMLDANPDDFADRSAVYAALNEAAGFNRSVDSAAPITRAELAVLLLTMLLDV